MKIIKKKLKFNKKNEKIIKYIHITYFRICLLLNINNWKYNVENYNKYYKICNGICEKHLHRCCNITYSTCCNKGICSECLLYHNSNSSFCYGCSKVRDNFLKENPFIEGNVNSARNQCRNVYRMFLLEISAICYAINTNTTPWFMTNEKQFLEEIIDPFGHIFKYGNLSEVIIKVYEYGNWMYSHTSSKMMDKLRRHLIIKKNKNITNDLIETYDFFFYRLQEEFNKFHKGRKKHTRGRLKGIYYNDLQKYYKNLISN